MFFDKHHERTWRESEISHDRANGGCMKGSYNSITWMQIL